MDEAPVRVATGSFAVAAAHAIRYRGGPPRPDFGAIGDDCDQAGWGSRSLSIKQGTHQPRLKA